MKQNDAQEWLKEAQFAFSVAKTLFKKLSK